MLRSFSICVVTLGLLALTTPALGQTRTADGNIADLRAQMSGIEAAAKPFLARAFSLKYSNVALGAEISFDECVALEKKIEANYKLSPFKAIYDGGSSFFNFCTDEYNKPQTDWGAKFYFADTANIKTQLGLEGRFVLSKVAPNRDVWSPKTQVRINVVLDASYRMVEITFLNFIQDETQAVHYSINALDASGNSFRNEYYGPADTGDAHYVTHQKYISADGVYSFQQDLNPRRSDKGTGPVLSNFYSVATEKTWDDFFIVLSHAWSSGFYDTAGKIKSHAKAYSSLHIATVNGSEVCADGRASTLTEWTSYPSPTASFGYCMNDW